MATVFIHKVMSLDGFISKPDEHDFAWMFRSGSDEMAERMLDEVSAAMIGNRGFREGTMAEDILPYGGPKVPRFVVTHDARGPRKFGGSTFIVVAEGIERAVSLARDAAGNKRLALLGASICRQCLNAGLVDEIVIHLVPLLLGDGIRFFDAFGPRSGADSRGIGLAGPVRQPSPSRGRWRSLKHRGWRESIETQPFSAPMVNPAMKKRCRAK